MRRSTLKNAAPYLALIVALAATLGSLYYSEVLGFIPCTYCWYQRILMYPLVLILLVGIIKQDEYLPTYVLPLSLIGLGFSLYHVLIQNGLLPYVSACAGVSCSVKYVNYLGFISIPVMALTAFVLISGLMGLVSWWERQEDKESA